MAGGARPYKDGYFNKAPGGLFLCTHSFSIQETVRLMNVLMVRHRLDYTLFMKDKKFPLIYIKKESMDTLRSIVIPHLHPSMFYKIGL
jgi:hypothetical protein